MHVPNEASHQIDPKSVFVSNIAPTATETTIISFFAFCGKITKLVLKRKESDQPHEAIVTFETEAAAKTALLLANASIIDYKISVVPYVIPVEPPLIDFTPDVTVKEGSAIHNKDFGAVPDDQRTKTSVIASLMAAGYILGEDIIKRSREYDEKYKISNQVKVGVEEVKKTMIEMNNKLKISETASYLAATAGDNLKKIDEKYAISATAESQIKELDQKLSITPTVEYFKTQAIGFWNSVVQQPTVAAATSSVSTTYNEIATETNELIKKRQTQNNLAPVNSTVAPVNTDTPAVNTLVDLPVVNNNPINVVDANGELPVSK